MRKEKCLPYSHEKRRKGVLGPAGAGAGGFGAWNLRDSKRLTVLRDLIGRVINGVCNVYQNTAVVHAGVPKEALARLHPKMNRARAEVDRRG